MFNKVRVRFAPSPTGPLHIGGLRTALFNFLFAKKHNGSFILRIEDTDQARYVEGSEKHIYESLDWANLKLDEGPYKQSERNQLYKQRIEELLSLKKAYYAFDTKQELDAYRKEAESNGGVFVYNSQNRLRFKNSLSLGPKKTKELLFKKTPYVVRFKVSEREPILLNDLLKGKISFDPKTLDDKVLYKGDGTPTYHFANVVDDHDMSISHVIRGEEWLPSLPLHWLIYDSFGWKKPQFIHLPLILKPEGKGKLSKRDGEKFGFPVFPIKWTINEKEVMGFKEFGFLPEATLNYIALLGWNPGNENEIFDRKTLLSAFSLKGLNGSGSRFDFKKSIWINQQHMQFLKNDFICDALEKELEKRNISYEKNLVKKVVPLIKKRLALVSDIFSSSSYFFLRPLGFEEKLVAQLHEPVLKNVLKDLISHVLNSEKLSAEENKSFLQGASNNNSIGYGEVMKAVRLALVGSFKGADLFDIIQLIGKEEVGKRLRFLEKNM